MLNMNKVCVLTSVNNNEIAQYCRVSKHKEGFFSPPKGVLVETDTVKSRYNGPRYLTEPR